MPENKGGSNLYRQYVSRKKTLSKLTGVELCRLSASFFGAFRPFCFDGHCALCIKEGQKPHKNCLMSDASSFDRDGFLLRQGKARRKYCRIYKGFNAAWVKIIRSKPTAVDSRQLMLSLLSKRSYPQSWL